MRTYEGKQFSVQVIAYDIFWDEGLSSCVEWH